jgi:sterol 3beta-glucosyltransferase
VCPFFGDQHFWGEMVHRQGLGPRPVSVSQLSLALVAESLEVLLRRDTRRSVAALSQRMQRENGVEGALEAFYRHLPLETMLCDVSLFCGQYRLAQVAMKRFERKH